MAPSYSELYICSKRYIKRVSDSKIILIDKVIQAFKTLECKNEIRKIRKFPRNWFLHNHWIEIEIPDMKFFLYNIDTMQVYYFDKRITVKNNHIYIFEDLADIL